MEVRCMAASFHRPMASRRACSPAGRRTAWLGLGRICLKHTPASSPGLSRRTRALKHSATTIGVAGTSPATTDGGNGPSLLAILLDTSGAQTGEAMAVDRVLPGQEFLDREGIAAAGLFKRKKAATHRRNDFRLAANHPALRSRRRKVSDRKRTSIGPDDVLHPRAAGLVHATLTHFRTTIH